MNSKITLNLIKHWQTLCFDIIFTDIGALLIHNKIISDEEFQLIVTQPEGSRVKSLLLILIKKDEQVLLKFVKCLDHQYGCIAEKLREGYEQLGSRIETDASPIVTVESDREAERESFMEIEDDEEEGESVGPSNVKEKVVKKTKNNNMENEKVHEHICKNKQKVNGVNRSPKINNFMYNKYKVMKKGHLTKTKVKNRVTSRFENSDVVSSTTEVAKPVPDEGESMDVNMREVSTSEDEEESSIKNINVKKSKKKKFILVNTTSDEDDLFDNTDFESVKKSKKKVGVKIKKALRNEESEYCLKNEITDKVITIIRRTPLVSGRWTAIAHSLGLTDRIRDIRFKVGVYGEDISMCIVYLLKDWVEMFPKRAKLTKLIEVLRSERFNDVADKLTKILYGEDKKCKTVKTLMMP